MSEPQVSIKPAIAKVAGTPIAERMRAALNYDELTNCMRCGFCQPSCPTFKETGLEAASPRGRIALMKAVVDGIMEPDETFQNQMDLCLGCRACEPVCPADVKYGQLIEQTRDAIEDHKPHRWWVRQLRTAAFEQLFPFPKRMLRLGGALRLYQRSGLRKLARTTGAMKLLPDHLRTMEAIMPDTSAKGVAERMGPFYPAKGTKIARVGMFRGCLMDMMFTETNVNTVELLSEAGFEVVIPDTQTCCGALHAHSGELDQARALARRNIAAFKEAGVDYIVSNAGGCGALLVEYDHLLHDDPAASQEASWFAERVKDVSQIVMEKGDLRRIQSLLGKEAGTEPDERTTVTYQDSCHLRNVMHAGNAPRDLLTFVKGVRFNELRGADTCCGSAGIYNLQQPAMSSEILDHKMEHVKETNAQVLLTSNPGCLLQMKAGIEKAGLSDRMKAMHVVDFLMDRMGCESQM
jgi:glycolate oxidase iron-sulfur subunit